MRLAPTIAATSLGFALVQLDVSIVNVALARIGASLRSPVSGLQWVVDAYAITFAALLLSAGVLGDRVGSRKVFIAGLALFGLASLACGLAPNAAGLIAARVLQGVGAAPLVPCSLALLTHACGEDAAARGRAVSVWTAAASLAIAAGPVLGGVLVDTLGWRSIFLINLPIVGLAIPLTARFVVETPPRTGGFDLAGQGLAIAGLFGLAGAVIEAGRLGVGAPLVLGGFALAALAGVAFVRTEARSADPMLPLGFFQSPTFSAAVAIGLLINLTLYGVIFVFALYLQQIRGYSPIATGFAFLPFAVSLGIGNLAAGWVGAHAGLRAPMAAGLAVGGLGYWLLRPLDAALPYRAMLPGLVIIPAGVGLAVPLMTSALLASVPRSRSGAASGVLNTARQAGGGIGVALFGALLAGRDTAGLNLALTISAVLLGCGAVLAGVGIRPGSCSPHHSPRSKP